MKKGLCIILSIMMVLVSFVACGKKDDKEQSKGKPVTQVVTDANGEEVTDKNGEVVTEKVTDKNGDVVTEKAEPSTKPSSSTNSTGSGDSDESSNNDIPPVKNPDPYEEGQTINKTQLRDEVVKPVFESKKFTMKVNVVAEGVTMPMTMTVNGNDFAFLVSMDSIMDAQGSADMEGMEGMAGLFGGDVKIICKNGKTYTAMKMFGQKIYIESDEDMLGVDMDGLMDPTGDETQKYVKTTQVKDGKKTYTCEEYKSKDGSVTKYYFEGKKFVRVEMIAQGTTSIMEISEFKNTVDNKIFDLKGYKEFDPNSLGSLGM